MSKEIELKCDKNPILNGIQDDVYPTLWNTIATDMPSVNETESEHVITEINDGVALINNQNYTASDLNLKADYIEQKDDEDEEIKNIISGGGNNNDGAKIINEQFNNNNNNIHNKTKRKRRRRKSKRSNNSSSYGKTTHWKFQVPRAHENRRNNKKHNIISMIGKPLVPYNTNKFLMEEHMPEVTIMTPTGRTRDSSFSVDSEDNYFYSLPEEEEDFLTKEFSSVYEDARAERLENMSKTQLIQEYLQLESNFEQLNRRYNAKTRDEDPSIESLNKIRILEEQIKQLTSENLDLRRKIEYPKRKPLQLQDDRMCSNTDSSEDSESDSTSSSNSTSNSRNISISSSISGSAAIKVDDYTMRLNVNNDNHSEYPLINHIHQNGYRSPLMSPHYYPVSPTQLLNANNDNNTEYPLINHIHQNGFKSPRMSPDYNPLSPTQRVNVNNDNHTAYPMSPDYNRLSPTHIKIENSVN